MQKNEVPREDKYVPILCFLTKEFLPTLKTINQFDNANKNSKEIRNYLNWTQSENEIVTYNSYGMYELEVPQVLIF